ncbi:MAG: omega-6 fatty acid desaturase (delta-12 desaturase) [Polaribacter sp.]|jgi:omega-6 fatty acid desaturase (delta-12 desaturase)
MKVNTEKINEEIKESLKHWQKIVAQYQKPDTTKAVIQILNSFGPYVALWVLMYFSLNWSIFITIGLGIVNAFFLVRIFIIQHDCGHQSFFSSKKVNNVVGYVCSFFSFMPYKYWAKVHNFHHGHAGQIEVWDIGDIPTLTVKQYQAKGFWGKLGYRIWRSPIITFVVAPIYYMLVSNRLPTIRIDKLKKAGWSQVRNNIAIAVVYIALALLLGWKKFLFVQFFLIFSFGIISFWFFYVQHQHEESYKQWKHNWDYVVAAIRGSSYYKLPKVFQWLTGNIGIHHIHHLSSLIPNYNLEKCMTENKVLNKYVTVVTFWESLKLMSCKLWDEEKQRMISFKEYTMFYRMAG